MRRVVASSYMGNVINSNFALASIYGRVKVNLKNINCTFCNGRQEGRKSNICIA